jgi:hypothetical protein
MSKLSAISKTPLRRYVGLPAELRKARCVTQGDALPRSTAAQSVSTSIEFAQLLCMSLGQIGLLHRL